MAEQSPDIGQPLRQRPVEIVLSDVPALDLVSHPVTTQSALVSQANSICFKSLLVRYGLEILEDQLVTMHERLERVEQRAREEGWNGFRRGAKKIRRPANEIERKFSCQAPGCGRKYGTTIALNKHRRNKHSAPSPSLH